jgi:hypothetical protein
MEQIAFCYANYVEQRILSIKTLIFSSIEVAIKKIQYTYNKIADEWCT